jgi:hypothetical protein
VGVSNDDSTITQSMRVPASMADTEIMDSVNDNLARDDEQRGMQVMATVLAFGFCITLGLALLALLIFTETL